MSNLAFKGPRTGLYRKNCHHKSILADVGSILGGSGVHLGDDLGVFWGYSRACFRAEKATYINFQNIDFVAIGGACAVFYEEFAHLVPVHK